MTKIVTDYKKLSLLLGYDEYLLSVEREILYDAIVKANQNRAKAAANLGISYRKLRYSCGKCGLGEAAERARIDRLKSKPPISSYASQWPKIRMQILKRDGNRCKCCGATPEQGACLHVDHIKPKDIYPHLALDMDNLQTLCSVCNLSKGKKDETRF